VKLLAGLAAAALALSACSDPADPLAGIVLRQQDSGVAASLRGLAVVDAQTAWIGAPDGQVLRTVNGGEHWTVSRIPGAEGLDLRSVHAFSAAHALFFTAGHPARLYVTHDGGAQFDLVWEDPSGEAFFDTLEFWNDRIGLAFSDPVDGAFMVLMSEDGGASWQRVRGLPDPLGGEAGFAASDTSVALAPNGCAFIGTGGAATARILRSCDGGTAWQAFETPLASGSPGAGIFSLAWMGERLIAAGGDYQNPDARTGTLAWSDDGGQSWQSALEPPGGYRSAVAVLPTDPPALIATGPTGTDISRNGGEIWIAWEALPGHHAIRFAPDSHAGWAVGSGGRITRIEIADD
jgi:photosystem II stability/assembly factor-like uncharacterized protein